MTKDRAIELVLKLRRISESSGTGSEASTAKDRAQQLQEKFSITDQELKASTRESESARTSRAPSSDGEATDDDLGLFLKDFERSLRVDLLVAGRKTGRFHGHPHTDKIIKAAQRRGGRDD
jgi:hypothetical protein